MLTLIPALAFGATLAAQDIRIEAEAWLNTLAPITAESVRGKTVLLAAFSSAGGWGKSRGDE